MTAIEEYEADGSCSGLILTILVLLIGWFLYSRYFANPKWSFVGYQYRWSRNYSTAEDFDTQEACVQWGNLWLGSQTSEEALFTCSPGCKADKDSHGIDICEKVCEYNREGLIRCRD